MPLPPLSPCVSLVDVRGAPEIDCISHEQIKTPLRQFLYELHFSAFSEVRNLRQGTTSSSINSSEKEDNKHREGATMRLIV